MQKPDSETVLVVEMNPDTGHLSSLKSILESAHLEVVIPENLAQQASYGPDQLARMTIKYRPCAIILALDQRTFPDNLPLDRLLGPSPIDVPIIIAAHDLEASQIEALLEMGAIDFITPPFTSASLLPRIWRLVRHRAFVSGIRGTVREKLGMQNLGLLGESASFVDEIRKLPLIARCDVTVMVSGETGTGKELIARAVHYLSPRHDRPFVPIDCGAIPPELAESEIFGHERGAFTGAVRRNPGLISAADHGSLFLDEVDGLGLSVQAKLLRFLQQMEYRSLGSSEIKRADVRVISATNCDLQQQVRNGEFREDLYYRLNVVQLHVPSLRQRSEDVILLARHFAAKYSRRFNRPARDFSGDALQSLLLHQWPGNVRELENIVEAAVALCDSPLIRASDLLFAGQQSSPPVSFREAKAQTINEFEREYVVRLLCACGGNVSAAARAAGKNRRAFWELIRKHGVDVPELRDSSVAREERKPSARAARVGARHFTSDHD